MKKLTIFTPTYNRDKLLPRLYESLINQTCKDFVWLIVDDGSNDGTKGLIDEYISDGIVKIRYYFQENQGKSFAHNYGVKLSDTELFTCVDSDDWLSNDAVESILNSWKFEKNTDDGFIGIIGFKGHKDGKSVTSIKNKKIERATLRDSYQRYGLTGDTMLIYQSDVIKKYSFPKFINEKFVPENYLYDQLDTQGKMIILRKVLYYCEYLENGYSNNMAKLLTDNPHGYLAYIEQRLKLDENFIDRYKDTARYIAMAKYVSKKKIIRNSYYKVIAFLAYPLGMVLYRKRYKKYL
jgi:glycosyltransferase involved in cell wall biosynthesis